MSGLAQFDASYNPEEDRILIRITNTEADEFRLWLTRRLSASLLADFKVNISVYRLQSDSAEKESESAPRASEMGAATLMRADMQQEAHAAKQDFEQKFIPGERFPLGEQGVVVDKIDFQADGKGAGNHALNFIGTNGQQLSIGVTPQFLNTFFEVIERVSQQAEWGLITTSSSMARSATLQ